ncbi:MAG: PAS domain S-box protein [Chloroflexi bacterium]|nr:PAS domain S-box protein [Chloroflexota bacterium]
MNKLQNTQLHLQLASKLAHLGYWDWYIDTNEYYLSPDVYKILGQDPAHFEVSSESVAKIIHPEELSLFLTERELSLREKQEVQAFHRITWPDGSIRYVHIVAEISRDEQGTATHIAGIIQDITEQKQAEETLQQSLDQISRNQRIMLALSQAGRAIQRARTTEEVYQAIQEQSSQLGYTTSGLTITDSGDLQITFVGYQAELIHKAEHLTGLKKSDYTFPASENNIFQQVLVTGETINVADVVNAATDALPKKLRTLAGPIVKMIGLEPSTFSPMIAENQIYGILIIAGRDITEADNPAITAFSHQAAIALQNARLYEATQNEIAERKLAEEALKHSESQLREVINSMEKAIAIYEAVDNGNDFVFVDMNIHGEKITHLKIEAVLGRRISELFPGEPSIGLIEKLKETWLTGHSTQIPLKQYVDERITQWVENYIFKLPSGRVVAMFEDTLEKRAAELALLESEERYSNLFNQMMDGYAVHEMIFDKNNHPVDYRFVSINPTFETMVGLDSSIIGRTVLEVLPATEPYWIEAYGKVVQTGEPVEFENYSKEIGKWFAVVAYRSDVNSFVTIFSDITDRKAAEAALQLANSELEDRVSERTRELQILVNSMAGREVRMADLKKAIKKLRRQIQEAGMEPVADDPLNEGLL